MVQIYSISYLPLIMKTFSEKETCELDASPFESGAKKKTHPVQCGAPYLKYKVGFSNH